VGRQVADGLKCVHDDHALTTLASFGGAGALLVLQGRQAREYRVIIPAWLRFFRSSAIGFSRPGRGSPRIAERYDDGLNRDAMPCCAAHCAEMAAEVLISRTPIEESLTILSRRQ